MSDSKELIDNLADELVASGYSVYIPKNVCIEGDKNGFNSKMALEKFKTSVKNMDRDINKNELDLEELKNKYVKSNYILEIIKHDQSNKDIIIKISENNKQQSNTDDTKKKILKDKLNSMKKNRTNVEYHKAKQNENIPDDILKEYLKLKKVCNMPIPEPGEILSNPEQYKPILSMVLNNKMTSQIGTMHPYIKYFKLIAQKLNIKPLDIPSEVLENIKSEISKSEISNNKISNNDDDTDEED